MITVFGDGKVVDSQLFGDFILEGLFFFQGSIVRSDHLEKIVMGFFVRDLSGSVGDGRMDVACFF